MAATEFPVGHALAQKLWSQKLFHDIISETWVSKFLGNDSNSLIQIQTDTQKRAGDRITVGLRALMTGAGVQNDDTLEGNEEALVTYSDNVYLNQLRHAARSKGKMSEQRVPFDVREENRVGLRDWWTERIEVWAANQLANYTGQTDTRYTGNNSTFTVDSEHLVIAGATGATTELSISSTTVPGTGQYFQLRDIDICVAKAKTMTPKIRPIRIGGKDWYVMFLHPYSVYALRNDASLANSWALMQRSLLQGGKELESSPLGNGALGVYNQTILHEWSYVPVGVSFSAGAISSVNQIRRNIFCGAQAASMCFGQDGSPNSMTWVEELFDFGNQLGVSAGMIAGLKASQFNSKNFGSIVVSSYAPTV